MKKILSAIKKKPLDVSIILASIIFIIMFPNFLWGLLILILLAMADIIKEL